MPDLQAPELSSKPPKACRVAAMRVQHALEEVGRMEEGTRGGGSSLAWREVGCRRFVSTTYSSATTGNTATTTTAEWVFTKLGIHSRKALALKLMTDHHRAHLANAEVSGSCFRPGAAVPETVPEGDCE